MRFFNNTIGPYPYKEYNVVQGGEGGMEYAMLTLISGDRNFRDLAGVTAHELAHSWFQHILATNELFAANNSSLLDSALNEDRIIPQQVYE